MKRSLSILISLILLLLLPSGVFAGGLSSGLPAPEAYSGFDDMGSARAVLFDLSSGAVLYERNGDAASKPGSLPVMMTALLLIENTSPEDWDTPLPALSDVASRWSRRGSRMGLNEGDTPSRRDLLYGLLLTGAADAAYVTELLISQSEASFVELMNSRAAEIGMSGTHFDNGYGLGSNGQYSCANDMARLTMEAMKHQMFSDAVACQSYICSVGSRSMEIVNRNTALEDPSCIGIKTGFDSEREYCAVKASRAGGALLCAVVLEAPGESAAMSYADRLISVGFTKYLSECGLRSYTPTDALFRADSDTVLKSEPTGSPVRTAPSGETLRVCGYTEENGSVYYCVYDNGAYVWAKDNGDLSFITYVNDIFIENSPALSRETVKGASLDAEPYASSRHSIESVKLTLTLPDGSLAASSTHTPCSHGVCEFKGTSLTDSIDKLYISEGLYNCTIEVTAKAYVPGAEETTVTRSNSSLLAVGTGGECVSYNAAGGDGAPDGECFFDSFTVPAETPVRTGFVFSHWNTAPDGSGTSYRPGDTVNYEGSLTLYALWAPGADMWETETRILYDGSLFLEGFVKNTAGVASLRLVITGGEEREMTEMVFANEAAPGELFLQEPILLGPGEYDIALYGTSAMGEERLLCSQKLTLTEADATATPPPAVTETPAPTQNGGEPSPIPTGLAGIPIWIWFLIGTVVVAVLIALIVIIIKRG